MLKTRRTPQKIVEHDRLPHGYAPKRLRQYLETHWAATIPQLILAIPAERRHPSIKSTIKYALRGGDFVSPCFGVYCLRGHSVPWSAVAATWSPLNGEVLDALHTGFGRTPLELASTLGKDIADIRKALHWLHRQDLAFSSGGRWGKSAKGDGWFGGQPDIFS